MLKLQTQHKLYAYYGGDIWTDITYRSVTHPVLGKKSLIYKTLHRLSNTNTSKIWGWTHVLQKGKQFLLH